jgi:hypothetical protein
MTRQELLELCLDATAWLDVCDRDDAAVLADRVIDRLVEALRADASLPRRARSDWWARLSGLRQRVKDDVTEMFEGCANYDAVIRALADALLEQQAQRRRRGRQRARQRNQAQTAKVGFAPCESLLRDEFADVMREAAAEREQSNA